MWGNEKGTDREYLGGNVKYSPGKRMNIMRQTEVTTCGQVMKTLGVEIYIFSRMGELVFWGKNEITSSGQIGKTLGVKLEIICRSMLEKKSDIICREQNEHLVDETDKTCVVFGSKNR